MKNRSLTLPQAITSKQAKTATTTTRQSMRSLIKIVMQMQFIFYLFSFFSILLRLFHFVQCKQTIVDRGEDSDYDLVTFAYDVFVQCTSDSSILTRILFFSVQPNGFVVFFFLLPQRISKGKET